MSYLLQQRRDAAYDIIDEGGRYISGPHADRAAAYAAIERHEASDRRRAA